MKERIQKILSSRGVASRRKAEIMINDGRVRCNGRICTIGDCADPETDVILVDGNPLPSKSEHVYILLNKPRGFVTTLSDEKGRKNVAQLVSDCATRVYPVGRLDMDSEGLLLLTNDGEFANRLMHPSHEVDKTYFVTVRNFSLDALERLKRPIEIDGYLIKAPTVTLVRVNADNTALLSVVIHEGRNRQVRKMCDTAGMSVLRLVRVREGALELGTLPTGKWRYLTNDEISSLMK